MHLKHERLIEQEREDKIVNCFRYRFYGRQLLGALRQNCDESKIEKEKMKFKAAMWSKVNNWLDEIDKKQEDDK